ncbi:CHAT domain-containing protein [Tolypothrix bouteillei VB521301]|uniref:CHAT domain-containing protein n=1 Tax=Tolypothrix bouteillei VB521301 TaxID=1479485 RepID=A0A0C1R7B1_9CYAN|nr:CHAT domain-containing protein [Tolypothrix bouteillei VB521301]
MTAILCIFSSPVFAKLPPSPPLPHSLASPIALLQQGKVLYDGGRYSEAVQVLQQAAQQYQQQGDAISRAATLSNLSLAYQQLGAWNEAKQAIASSLDILGYTQQDSENKISQNPKSQIQNLPILAQTLDIEGRMQLGMGQLEEALVTWQNAEKVYHQANDKNGVVRSRINQAQALRTQGFYRRAEALLVQVNETLRSQPDSLEKAVGLRSLGDVLQLVGDLDKSNVALQQSLEVAQRIKSAKEISASLFSLGNNARALPQKPQAIAYYQKTVEVAPSPLTKIQAQLNLLDLFVEDKQIANAQNLIPSIQSQLDQLPPSRAAIYARINFAQSLSILDFRFSSLNSQQSQSKINQESQSKTQNPKSKIGENLATAVQQARDLGDKRAEAYALGSLGSLYEQTKQWSESQKLTQQALFLAQTSNAPEITYRWQWQLGRLLKAQGDTKGAIAAYDAAVDTLQSLRSDLVAVNQNVQFTFRDSVEPVYRQSVELLLQSQQGQPDGKILEKARQRIEALQLAELDNFFREACLQGQRVPIDKVVDQDNPTAAILYPIILENKLQVIVKIPKQPLRVYGQQISQPEVEKTLSELRQNLVKPSAIKAFKTKSQQVYNWLIKPIESELQASGVNTLVFVLDGALRNIPPTVLYDGKQYLVEKYAVALSVGLQLFEPKPLVRQHLNALTAGLTEPPPEYSGRFSRLPAIKTELSLITQAGVSTTSLLDREFTSKALEKKVSNVPFNIVHLATHGEFSSRADKTFILASDGPIDVAHFGSILRSRDDIRPEAVQLLVLSACKTAAGDNRAALGLAGAAIKAGARSTVASLWQIDDESTAQFVGAFYRELKNPNISKAEALRRAQLQMLKHPNFNTPSFWSAYVLIGNWL